MGFWWSLDIYEAFLENVYIILFFGALMDAEWKIDLIRRF